MCELRHIDGLPLARTLSPCLPTKRRWRESMRRHIKIAIAITMMGLFALMFWQTILGVTGKDDALAGAQSNPSMASPSIHTYQFRDLHRSGENSFPSRATLF